MRRPRTPTHTLITFSTRSVRSLSSWLGFVVYTCCAGTLARKSNTKSLPCGTRWQPSGNSQASTPNELWSNQLPLLLSSDSTEKWITMK